MLVEGQTATDECFACELHLKNIQTDFFISGTTQVPHCGWRAGWSAEGVKILTSLIRLGQKANYIKHGSFQCLCSTVEQIPSGCFSSKYYREIDTRYRYFCIDTYIYILCKYNVTLYATIIQW